MRQLIRQRILPAIGNEHLRLAGDAAVLPACRGRLAMTTDSFVVSPLFFPGGDIGSLAVYGTANDLAVAGAQPRWISLALILEEGLEFAVLQQAKVDKADLLVAVTRKDSTNLFCAQVARTHFRVPEAVARVYDPTLAAIFQGSGITAISPVAIAAERFFRSPSATCAPRRS